MKAPSQEKITDSHFWVFKEYPQKSQIWKSETSPNLGTWLGIPWLGLVSLCQIWDFYGYSLNTQKYPKMGISYCFLCILSTKHFSKETNSAPSPGDLREFFENVNFTNATCLAQKKLSFLRQRGRKPYPVHQRIPVQAIYGSILPGFRPLCPKQGQGTYRIEFRVSLSY